MTIRKTDRPRILVVSALEQELYREGLESEPVITGIGKINATFHLTSYLYRPVDLVLNLGTAGSTDSGLRGKCVEVLTLFQGDMDCQGLGYAQGKTPFDDVPSGFTLPKRAPWLQGVACITADTFVTSQTPMPSHVFDMEAYALMKVCFLMKVPFMSIKYVSDDADQKAEQDWRGSIQSTASIELTHQFWKVYHSLKSGAPC